MNPPGSSSAASLRAKCTLKSTETAFTLQTLDWALGLTPFNARETILCRVSSFLARVSLAGSSESVLPPASPPQI